MNLIIFSAAGCIDDEPSGGAAMVDVGVYVGAGVWEASVKAAFSALQSMNFSLDSIETVEILQGSFKHCRILLVPGGDARLYSEALGTVGRDRIRHYAARGGGYIGFGGGAALAGADSGARLGLGLLTTSARWPVDLIAVYPQWTMTAVYLRQPEHPVGRGFHPRFTTLYRWGPDFPNPDPARVDVLSEYLVTGTPAAVATEYGAGAVVLFGFQPEFEEGSARDSSGFGGDLNDPESEWPLIENAVKYCLSAFRSDAP